MITIVKQEVRHIEDDNYMVVSSSNGAILAYCSTKEEAETVIQKVHDLKK
jgi:hypothetical protein